MARLGFPVNAKGLPPTEVPFLAREAIPIDDDGGESTRRTQGGVFLFNFDQDRDVQIHVLPNLEKSVIGFADLRQVAGKRVGSGEPQVRQRVYRSEGGQAAMVDNLLEFGSCIVAGFHLKVG